MRLFSLLILVFGSALCEDYYIDLYNNLTQPLTVYFTYNNYPESSYILPARVNGVATKSVFKLESFYHDRITFGTNPMGLLASIKRHQFDPHSNSCSLYVEATDISLSYNQQAGNIPIAMSLRTFGSSASIECNTLNTPRNCIMPYGGPESDVCYPHPNMNPQPAQNMWIDRSYWRNNPIQIWFSPQ